MEMGEMAGMGVMAGPMADRALCDAPLVAALLFVFGLALFMLKVAPPGTGLDADHNPLFWMLRLLAVVQLLLCPSSFSPMRRLWLM